MKLRSLLAVGLGFPCVAAVWIACGDDSISPASRDGGPEGGGANVEAGAVDDGGNVVDSGGDGGGADSGDAGFDPTAPTVAGTGHGWKSGTRLRAYVDTTGSAGAFTYWRDVQLGVDCFFAPATDANQRCIPFDTSVDTVYEDDKCTIPVAVVPTGVTPKYLSAPSDAPCAKLFEVYSPGTSYTPPALFQRFDGKNCNSYGAVDTANNTYLHVGAAVAPTTFVLGTQSTDPRGARVSAHVLTTADGASQDYGLIDTMRTNAGCEVYQTQAGPYVCLPEVRAATISDDGVSYFAEGTCTTKAAAPGFNHYGDCYAGTPTAVIDSEVLSVPLALHEIGAALDGGFESQQDGGACPPSMLAETFYGVGASLAVASLPQITTASQGTGRMHVLDALTESNAFAGALNFDDTQVAGECHRFTAEDGRERCLPVLKTYGGIRFSDAACTNAILESDTPTTATWASLLVTGGMYKLGATIATPAAVYDIASDQSCSQGVLHAGSTYYAATHVAATQFARAAVLLE
jgi:hypothetical protein